MYHSAPDLPFDISTIKTLIPHRYPLLLVDKVIELEPKVYIKSCKSLTYGEPIFQGHFPDRPIYPAVFMLEGMAQSATILGRFSLDQNLFDI